MAIREVTFRWDDCKGECYDCGNPAAYAVPDAYGPNPDDTIEEYHLRCSVCAAGAAADGARLVYLFAEDGDAIAPKRVLLPVAQAQAVLARISYYVDNGDESVDEDERKAADTLQCQLAQLGAD